MATERTFSIIKPDATRRNLTGAIPKMLEEAGLRVIASKRIQMSREQAEGFYGVHRERPFFNDLVAFMTSGPVVVQVLEATTLSPASSSLAVIAPVRLRRVASGLMIENVRSVAMAEKAPYL